MSVENFNALRLQDMISLCFSMRCNCIGYDLTLIDIAVLVPLTYLCEASNCNESTKSNIVFGDHDGCSPEEYFNHWND